VLESVEEVKDYIRYDTTRQSIVFANMLEESIDNLWSIANFMAWDELCHLREMLDDYPNVIFLGKSGWKTT